MTLLSWSRGRRRQIRSDSAGQWSTTTPMATNGAAKPAEALLSTASQPAVVVPAHPALSIRAVTFLVGAVQFVNILDFMMVMRLRRSVVDPHEQPWPDRRQLHRCRQRRRPAGVAVSRPLRPPKRPRGGDGRAGAGDVGGGVCDRPEVVDGHAGGRGPLWRTGHQPGAVDSD